MRGEVFAAAERLDKRKEAALGDEAGDTGIAEDLGPFLLSGFDLDLEELALYCTRIREIAHATVAEVDDPADVALALNVEGIAMGLLIAEGRK